MKNRAIRPVQESDEGPRAVLVKLSTRVRLDLQIFYDQGLEEIVELWNIEATSLGLELLRPLEGKISDNNVLRLNGCPIWLDLRYGVYDHPYTRMEMEFPNSCSVEQVSKIFRCLWNMSILPREAVLADEDQHLVEDILSWSEVDLAPETLLGAMEGNHNCFGVHSLRAYRQDLIESHQDWLVAASERGFDWELKERCFVLNIDWKNAGQRQTETDPISGVLCEDALSNKIYSLTEDKNSVGTAFLVRLAREDLNPGRSYEGWCVIVPEIAKTLVDFCGPDGVVGRFYSLRNLLVVLPSVSKERSKAEETILLNKLAKHGTKASTVDALSWPEDLEPNDREGLFGTMFDLMCGYDEPTPKQDLVESKLCPR